VLPTNGPPPPNCNPAHGNRVSQLTLATSNGTSLRVGGNEPALVRSKSRAVFTVSGELPPHIPNQNCSRCPAFAGVGSGLNPHTEFRPNNPRQCAANRENSGWSRLI
jgi:hypothetical protein